MFYFYEGILWLSVGHRSLKNEGGLLKNNWKLVLEKPCEMLNMEHKVSFLANVWEF